MNGGRNRFFILKLCIIVAAAALLRQHHVSAQDAVVMANLAKSLTPVPAGWKGNEPCKWPGVVCDDLENVRMINLSSKAVAGRLPPDFDQLSTLKYLHLEKNQLSGPLPSFSNFAYLEDLNLDGNDFTSLPPNFFAGMTSLKTVSINDIPTLAPWKFPTEIIDCVSLIYFSCVRCNLVGLIPDIFRVTPSLRALKLSYNNLTGSLPPSLADSGIQVLALNNQFLGLSGRIDVIGAMEQVTQVWLHVNKFTGPIPDLSRCNFLFDLELRDNLLTGVIPNSLDSLPKLRNVSLQNNKFQGPMPTFARGVQVNLGNTNSFCFPVPGNCDQQVNVLLEVAKELGYPSDLADSWKGNDPCEDWNFIACDENGKVSVINLSKHNWIGRISPVIANLTALKELILHDNKLSGVIPESLTKLPQLDLVDVSNNNISGKVPKFSSKVTVKTDGNPLIGEIMAVATIFAPTVESPTGSKNPNTAKTEKKNGNGYGDGDGDGDGDGSGGGGGGGGHIRVSHRVVIAISIAAVLQIVAICWIIYRRCKKMRSRKYKWMKEKGGNKEKGNGTSINVTPYGTIRSESSVSRKNSEIHHLYDGGNVVIPIEILRQVTDNFSEKNVLGKGGFGVVYKGKLNDGTQIAVKRMESNLLNSKGIHEFKAEIEVLSKVKHRHLVALHGFCVNGHERLLVYEYMPQGTLGQHLFDCENISPLTWKQRVTIALDVARGVEYLHSLAQQSFIHRDLKPSNILLGDGMRAKVSDFGLVKNAPDGTHSLETKLAGTFGYLAPEYAATGRVTTKVDVYAFGVVLMEMITGRKALDESLPEESVHLVPWFRRLLANREKLRSILDPCLDPDDETFESNCRVADLAGYCTAREPHQRPDMSHAVNFLSPLVEQWIPVRTDDDDDDDSFGIDFHMSLPQELQRWQANEDSTIFSEDNNNLYDSSYTSSSTIMERLPSDDSTPFRKIPPR